MALESFRQLILDAQAMMDPDFAGKLSADVAGDAEADDADTGFEFGRGRRSRQRRHGDELRLWRQRRPDSASGRASFSPFAAARQSGRFLKMPKKAGSDSRKIPNSAE